MALTREQAIALARARKRQAEGAQGQQPVQPQPIQPQQQSIADVRDRIREELIAETPQTVMEQRAQAFGLESQRPPGARDFSEGELSLRTLRATAPKSAKFARDLPEIGNAPELNQINLQSARRGLAQGLIANEAELANAIANLTPGAEVQQDPEGKALVRFPSGETFAVNKPGLSGSDFLNFSLRALAFTPAGRIVGGTATQLGKGALASAVTEAGLQAAETQVGGEFDIAPVAVAGALQPVAQAIPSALGVIQRVSRPAPESQLVSAGRELGIPILTSDVLQPRTFAARALRETGEKIPLIGTGELRAAQQQFRRQALDDVAHRYGEFSYDAIIRSLRTQQDTVKRAAGNVMNQAERRLDDIGQIPTNRTVRSIEDAREAILRPGVVTSEADRVAISELDNLLTTMQDTGQIFSTLKQNRTAFNEIIKGVDNAERSQLTSRTKSILESISRAMKGDMDEFASANLSSSGFSKWQRANAVYAEEATKLTKSRLKNVLDKGDITPENVKTLLFSRKPSEVRLLSNSLTTRGRQNARAAVISRIFDDAQGVGREITPDSFANALKNNSDQIEILFRGADRRQLQGLEMVLNATRRAQQASVTTNTGQALFAGGLGLSLATNQLETLLTAGSIGGIARLYESAPVRNALLRVAAAPPNRIDSAVQSALVAIAQSSRNLEQAQE
jgi:hypothetical protein